MAAPSVVHEPTTDKPTVSFISRITHRGRLGGISKSTELRLINTDPDHPRPVPLPPGGQVKGYVDHESVRYCELLLKRARPNEG